MGADSVYTPQLSEPNRGQRPLPAKRRRSPATGPDLISGHKLGDRGQTPFWSGTRAAHVSVAWAFCIVLVGGCGSEAAPASIAAADSVEAEDTASFDLQGNRDVPIVQADVGGACGLEPAPVCDPAVNSRGVGCPCTGSADCDSDVCAPGADGLRCAQECIECCPSGLVCAAATLVGADSRFICQEPHLALCRPCHNHAECVDASPGEDFCVDPTGGLGAGGRFCGTACNADLECPSGYACEEVSAGPGSATTQCVPESGACTCSPYASAQRFDTDCRLESEIGICNGTKACGPGGLGNCSAPTPAAETCDGLDNDCDGLVDDASCEIGRQCLCQDAQCRCACPNGGTDCGGACVDTENDPLYCGGCDGACSGPLVVKFGCVAKQCVALECQPGYVDLDKLPSTGCECVVSPERCDGVDNDCDGLKDEEQVGTDPLCPGEEGCAGTCDAGSCSCPEGCEACQELCVAVVSYETDTENCGGCGDGCDLPGAAKQVCEQGQCCATLCQSGHVDRNEDCSDGCECVVTPEVCDGQDNDCDGVVDEGTTLECADDDVCTVNERCEEGECTSSPTNCDDGEECTTDKCGLEGCTHVPVGANVACDDGLPCTLSDTCFVGSCFGQPKLCVGSACNDGACDALTGECGSVPFPDGDGCDDGDPCTTLDSCSQGACVPGPAVVCTSEDDCHEDGVCDPETGACSTPPTPDGKTCSDDNPCTLADACLSGSCIAVGQVRCDPRGPCELVGQCDPSSGACEWPKVLDETPCDDGVPCTGGATCHAGLCIGGTTCELLGMGCGAERCFVAGGATGTLTWIGTGGGATGPPSLWVAGSWLSISADSVLNAPRAWLGTLLELL